MRRPIAVLGSAIFLVIAPGTVALLSPFWISRWCFETPLAFWLPFRIAGALLIAAGLPGLIDSFARFALEGLGTPEKPHPIQKAFIDEQAVQCGFCLSGVILTAKVALDRNPKATGAQLQQALSNVLCRCGTHTRMMKAIRKYQQEVRA